MGLFLGRRGFKRPIGAEVDVSRKTVSQWDAACQFLGIQSKAGIDFDLRVFCHLNLGGSDPVRVQIEHPLFGRCGRILRFTIRIFDWSETGVATGFDDDGVLGSW